jgi:hypothetical protein
MAITASFSPNAKLLLVSSDNADDVITISCDAAGQILVNGGAVSIWGGQPTIANTAEIQVFSKGGEGKIVLDESNGTLPTTELFDEDDDEVRDGAASVQVVACNDRLMWKCGDGACGTRFRCPARVYRRNNHTLDRIVVTCRSSGLEAYLSRKM